MDYSKVIHAIVDPIVVNPDAIMIRELPNDDDRHVTILIASEKEDTSRMIGHKGIIANAIREVLSVAGKAQNKRIHIKFDSFEGDQAEGD